MFFWNIAFILEILYEKEDALFVRNIYNHIDKKSFLYNLIHNKIIVN